MDDSRTSVPEWCRGEEWCTVTATATLIDRKWKPIIIDRLLRHGSCGFSELQEFIKHISNKSLSENLKELENDRIVEREIVSERPFRVRYELTERGENLEDVVVALRDWGQTHLETDRDTNAPEGGVEFDDSA